MRLLTAFSVVSATGAFANNYAMAMADSSSADTSTSWASQAAAYTPPAMAMEASTSTMMAYEATTSSAMMHETTTSSAMMHDTTAMALVQETTSTAMMHDTSTSAMMHDTTSMAVAYTASVAPPMVQEGVMTHTVTVGGTAGLVYTPNQITAAVNDVVHFVFMSQNHTVTESTFAKPCNKQSADAPDSGFMSNPNNTVVPAPTFDYTVTSTDPTWWYCKQRTGNHCGKGMVFAINPTVDKSFDAFRMAAISINGTVAATSTSAAAVTATAVGTVTLVAGSSAAATTTTSLVTDVAATASAAPIVTGWNEGGASCQCACFCGVGAYPQGDGIGAYGGYGGSLPAPW